MILKELPGHPQIVPPGLSPNNSGKPPFHVDWYAELMGGLGDALLRVYTYESHYTSLENLKPGEKAAVVLMCHNPGLSQLFQWHPANISGALTILDIGFATPFHPWENVPYRVACGLPESSPCPMGPSPYPPIKFYESPKDKRVLQDLSEEKYIILHPSAGNEDRTIPAPACAAMVDRCKSMGYKVYLIGSSKYHKNPNTFGATSLVDLLSVPGMILAIRNSLGVITSHTSVTHVAWCEKRPVFLLYPQWVKDAYVSRGAEGYMIGINRTDTDHMLFSDFLSSRFVSWLETAVK